MTQEDKELLIKDMSARLPYGVKVHHLGNYKHNLYKLEVIAAVNYEIFITSQGPYIDNCPFIAKCTGIEEIKPYLFPLESMTEEQMEELKELCNMYTPDDDYHPYAYKGIKVLYKHVLDDNYKFNFKIDVIDWFNKNHFDYRGLIEKGLAIDATGLNIY
jgi:hypothetical protein